MHPAPKIICEVQRVALLTNYFEIHRITQVGLRETIIRTHNKERYIGSEDIHRSKRSPMVKAYAHYSISKVLEAYEIRFLLPIFNST